MTNAFLENKDCQKALYMAYVRVLSLICAACKINPNHVVVSRYGMSTVFSEVQADLQALQMRRPLKHGISPGKIAGSLAFRLCKTPVLTMTPEVAEMPIAQKLPVNVAVALAFEFVGTSFAIWPTSLVRELKYFLGKRHSNQESLGICFDTIACSDPKPTMESAQERNQMSPVPEVPSGTPAPSCKAS